MIAGLLGTLQRSQFSTAGDFQPENAVSDNGRHNYSTRSWGMKSGSHLRPRLSAWLGLAYRGAVLSATNLAVDGYYFAQDPLAIFANQWLLPLLDGYIHTMPRRVDFSGTHFISKPIKANLGAGIGGKYFQLNLMLLYLC
ncbi:hypothetical protein SJI00_20675 [Pseudomonas sp. RP23018S]|uniref:hypothetical protein n=1 Tax=Pseudomonas sp. RP23018S TaxID=3096037 RepID=UPI002AC9FBF4|nr:hypothetical protein [Pseudomonas sp. RP23018S]MDZ5605190.1 hypothetical protein [Pseudomonas sp. RP23018S]